MARQLSGKFMATVHEDAAIDELLLAVVNEMAEPFGRPHFQID